MALPEPSIDQWLAEAKQDPQAAQCGMYLTHNGVVRATPKAQVREGVEGLPEVSCVEFSYDADGLAQAVEEAKTWPGVYYVRVWLNEGRVNVGDSLMYVAYRRGHPPELHRRAAATRGAHQERPCRGEGDFRVVDRTARPPELCASYYGRARRAIS